MFDPALARNVAGRQFRRADTDRDERAAEPSRPVEDYLRNLAGWLPPARASARAVAQLFRAVEASTQVLQADDDAAVAEAFGQAVRLLRIGRGAAGDVEPLARVLA